MACFQSTVKSFNKEQQLIEISEDGTQDSEDDSESLKKEWNDDLFLEYNCIGNILTNYLTLSIKRKVSNTTYFSFIKTILTPPPRLFNL